MPYFRFFFATRRSGSGVGLTLSWQLCQLTVVPFPLRVMPGNGACFTLLF